jgi:ligand-binding sensor domain-containing protein
MFVSKTTNCGDTWTRYYLSAVGHTYTLAVDPSNSNIVYAGGNPGVFKTTNAGTNWIEVSSGITDYVMTIAIDPLAPNILYAGTRDGVFKSINSGNSWSNMGLGDVNSLIIHPAASDTVYAGTNSGVYISTSGGGTWQSMNMGLEDTNVTSLGIDTGVYLYATTYGAGMYRWSLEPGIQENNKLLPENPILFAHTNPVNQKLQVKFKLIESSNVGLIIYDTQGAIVKKFAGATKSPGIYTFKWNGKDKNNIAAPSGVYFYRLSVNNVICTRKFIWLK